MTGPNEATALQANDQLIARRTALVLARQLELNPRLGRQLTIEKMQSDLAPRRDRAVVTP